MDGKIKQNVNLAWHDGQSYMFALAPASGIETNTTLLLKTPRRDIYGNICLIELLKSAKLLYYIVNDTTIFTTSYDT